MNYRLPKWFLRLFLAVESLLMAAVLPLIQLHTHVTAQGTPPVRQVYVPYNVSTINSGIFWFGQVTSSDNYTDVRVRYTDDSLLVNFGIMDRLLWYDPDPTTGELTVWDSASLYLCRGGNVGQSPATDCFRFDTQLDWWESDRESFQAAYQGDGSQWVLTPVAFTTTVGWNGNAPNDNTDDRGWMGSYAIPFSGLGLSAPPVQGTMWGLGMAVHDRDSSAGPPLTDQVWPETLDTLRPATWGQLVFGLSPAYEPDPVLSQETMVIRQGLNGADVVDADVGGSSVCGDPAAPDYFSTWGGLNYAGKGFLNIQHLEPISEWPCFFKYYVIFPLDSLSQGTVVLSAMLTLYQFGNAGEGANPKPSFIQALTVGEDWTESSLTWNNAPLARNYAAGTMVSPLSASPPWPGIPRHWDVSAAVAEAHAAGQPLRLALYSADFELHSGKYFYTSDIGGDGEGCPTLTVTWGQPIAQLEKHVNKGGADDGESVVYELTFRGSGSTLMLTDTLPSDVTWLDDVMIQGTSIAPVYDSGQRQLTWTDIPIAGEQVFITYTVSVNTLLHKPLVNTGELADQEGHISIDTATVIANPFRCYLPVLLRP